MAQKPEQTSEEIEAGIIQELETSGFGDDYLILHQRTDIPDLMRAMDVMIFPSLSEGLGIVAIEAQAAGTHCLMSEGVPEGAVISNYAERMSLERSPEEWAEKAIAMCEDTSPLDGSKLEQWDMKNVVNELLEHYRMELTK
ncbi:MAG: glycosyltransferase [Synergistaceae bacterium]|nr:glycosyltransferase [Synergistaceae bacterium]